MSQYTTQGRLQATVDFGFQSNVSGYAKGEEGKSASSAQTLAKFFAQDDWYTDADSNAYSLPTFLGNHDMGRIGKFLKDAGNTGNELFTRDEFAHSLMYLTRGQPVVYYGDEQGFTGDGGDQDAREDMFPSQVASYNDNDLIGTDATTADANFDTKHPLYRHIADLAALRAKHPALADGAQVTRYADTGPGIFAFSRIAAGQDVEYVVAANSADTTKTATFPTYSQNMTFTQLWPTPASERGALRSDGSGQRHRAGAGAAGDRLPGGARPRRRQRVADAVGRDAPAGCGRRGAHADHRRRAAERPAGGHRALAAGRDDWLADARDGRQRAVPRLPGRAWHGEGLADRVPRGRPRPRR